MRFWTCASDILKPTMCKCLSGRRRVHTPYGEEARCRRIAARSETLATIEMAKAGAVVFAKGELSC